MNKLSESAAPPTAENDEEEKPSPIRILPAPPLRVAELRIQDLRVVHDLSVELGDLTVLVGENNVGKSTVLRSLDLALGGARVEDEDFRIDKTDQRADLLVVDLKVVPAGGSVFSDEIASRLGGAVQLATPQFATLRVRGRPGVDGSGSQLERRWVAGWASDRSAAMALAELETVRPDQLRLLSFFLLDARRDLVDELRQRRSYWGRILSDVGIPRARKEDLEAQIRTVGEDVVSSSEILKAFRAN